MNKIREVTTIIEDHIQWLAARESGERLINAPQILFFRLALPCENGDTRCSDTRDGSISTDAPTSITTRHSRCCRMVLGGEDVLDRWRCRGGHSVIIKENVRRKTR